MKQPEQPSVIEDYEMEMKMICVLCLLLFASMSLAGVKEGIDALNKGDYETARKEFLPLAEKGDDKAMITIALMYHQGQGCDQDYSTAMDWYIKAFKKGNGDAFSNIGVMYRDGLGVEKNKKIAYCLFLITHMRGLGDESTQIRAGRCLGRLAQELNKEDLIDCYGYTEEYVEAYVKARGKLDGIPAKYATSKKRLALKDENWWLDGELDFLK